MENVNLFSIWYNNNPLIVVSGECDYSLTITNSVLLSKGNNFVEYKLTGKVTIIVENCIVKNNYDRSSATFGNDVTYVDFGIQYLTVYPHYTNEICKGKKNRQ